MADRRVVGQPEPPRAGSAVPVLQRRPVPDGRRLPRGPHRRDRARLRRRHHHGLLGRLPVLPGKRHLDWELDDPAGKGVEAVRPIRDEIKQRILGLLGEIAAARASVFGRPRVIGPEQCAEILERRTRGETQAHIAAALGISRTSVARCLDAVNGTPSPA